MKTVTRVEAAEKLGFSLESLEGYGYLWTLGKAGVPTRFWEYKACKEEEYQREKEQLLEKGFWRKIIDEQEKPDA